MYAPRNILVTGGCGFIASHVIILLCNKYPQYKIVNLDCLDYCASLKNLESVQDLPNYLFVKGNILSVDLVRYIMKKEEIDTVLHFAAQSHVDNSFGNSVPFTEVNVLGTHVLLEAARCARVKLFLHVSTDEVYGESAYESSVEEERVVLEPTNPYAASKAAAEFIVKSYAKSFGLPTIITRSNNVYGPHQYPEKIIPKFICRLLRNKPCCVHGEGKNSRRYVFVKDVAKAFDLILHKGSPGVVYNVGTSHEVSNVEVARSLIQLFGLADRESEFIEYCPDRNINDKRYSIDSSRMNNLGWSPETPWLDGLRETIAWYRNNPLHWGNVEGALIPHPPKDTAIIIDEPNFDTLLLNQ